MSTKVHLSSENGSVEIFNSKISFWANICFSYSPGLVQTAFSDYGKFFKPMYLRSEAKSKKNKTCVSKLWCFTTRIRTKWNVFCTQKKAFRIFVSTSEIHCCKTAQTHDFAWYLWWPNFEELSWNLPRPKRPKFEKIQKDPTRIKIWALESIWRLRTVSLKFESKKIFFRVLSEDTISRISAKRRYPSKLCSWKNLWAAVSPLRSKISKI